MATETPSKKETKMICGRKHWRRLCRKCDGWCWTQNRTIIHYICATCSGPRFSGQQLGLTPGTKPVHSESQYNNG